MSMTLTAQFETRREAEMTVERLVQEHGIDRTTIRVAPAGSENTAGEAVAGADNPAGEPGVEGGGEPALNGAVEVSLHLDDAGKAGVIRQAFAEFGAHAIEER